MYKKNSFLNKLLESVRTHGLTLILLAIAFVIEGFDGGWVLDVPHVLIYAAYGILLTVYAMGAHTLSLLRKKDQKIRRLEYDREQAEALLEHHLADALFLVHLVTHLKNAFRERRRLADGNGLNTILRIVRKMFEEVELSVWSRGDQAQFQERAQDAIKQLLDELDLATHIY